METSSRQQSLTFCRGWNHHISNNFSGNMNAAYVLDGKALLHRIKETLFHPFEDLTCQKPPFMKNHGVKTVALVFDKYDQDSSIKQEKNRRHGDVRQATRVPNFRRVVKILANQSALALFVSDDVIEAASEILADERQTSLAGG